MDGDNQQPHSQDISPWDCDLFPRLKGNTRGELYYDLDELEDVMAEKVAVYERDCLATGVEDLPKQWYPVLDNKRYYFQIGGLFKGKSIYCSGLLIILYVTL